MIGEPLLSIEALVKEFPGLNGGHVLRAVDGVSLYLMPGEIVGLVGESGCGKSTLSRSIVGLERPTAGRIVFDGTDLATLRGRELRLRRRAIQYVFQDPYASLNERQTVEEVLVEAIVIAGRAKGTRVPTAAELLDRVGLATALAGRYPRELSGGQRQRVAIARALAIDPRVLICDEPVSALDLSARAQVMNLLFELCREGGVSCLLIAHDLALVRQAASRIYVMNSGRIVEEGDSEALYAAPKHPYTKELLSAVLTADPRVERSRRLSAVAGQRNGLAQRTVHAV